MRATTITSIWIHFSQRHRAMALGVSTLLRAGCCSSTHPPDAPKEARVHFRVWLTHSIIAWKVRHTQWRVNSLRPFDRNAMRRTDSLPPSETIPLHLLIFTDRLHMLFVQAMRLICLPF